LSLQAEPQISKEYQVKAVFLFNFAQFVAWPTNAFPEAQTPLTIGILGDDPFNEFLDDTVRGEKANGHPLAVQRFHRIEDVKDCQILFISRSENKHLERVLSATKGRNILTVGDSDGFIKHGGVIRFITVGNKIHFQVCLEAAKDADLAISSKMLRLAEIVDPGKD
jgi:hypothetical protein